MNEVVMSDSQTPVVQVSTPQSQPPTLPPSSTTPDVTMDPVVPQQQQQQTQQTRVSFATGSGQPLAPWDSRKWRDEYDLARSRLSDQNFNIGNYPDPLLPREPLQQPKGTEEAEQRLRALMATVEGRGA